MESTNATGTAFRTTSWTLIRHAAADPDAMACLLDVYWRPIYGFLRRSGMSRDDACDRTQDFICEVVLGRDLVSRADRDSGRFRSFVLTALKRFVIDAHRRERGRGGRRVRIQALESETLLALADPRREDSPEAAFNRQWAATVFSETLRRCELECREAGMEPHWKAFAMRHLDPLRTGAAPPSLDAVAGRLGLPSAERASHMIENVKRRLRAAKWRIVGETVDGSHDIDRELAELRQALGEP